MCTDERIGRLQHRTSTQSTEPEPWQRHRHRWRRHENIQEDGERSILSTSHSSVSLNHPSSHSRPILFKKPHSSPYQRSPSIATMRFATVVFATLVTLAVASPSGMSPAANALTKRVVQCGCATHEKCHCERGTFCVCSGKSPGGPKAAPCQKGQNCGCASGTYGTVQVSYVIL